MRKVWAMYFSATGTTERIVTAITDYLAVERPEDMISRFLRRDQKTALKRGNAVVFGVPVYAGRVPKVLVKYLNTVEGNGAKAVPVVVYGNRNYDDA